MKKLRTIVVEDERLPRLSLLKKLEDFTDMVEVVDSCETYCEARQSILRLRPDLLFLDIQLAGADSLELLEDLSQTIDLPFVIFTTAFTDSDYLLGAIKLSAVDYLVKPIGKPELAQAIAKVIKRAEILAIHQEPERGKLSFKAVNSKLFLNPDSIAWFKAEGNYTTIVTFDGQDLILESMLSLEKRLPGNVFKRIDRSTIVNISKVYRLNPQKQICFFRSENSAQKELELTLSKSGAEALLKLL
ncbi:MAG: response regulator transcription factor [Bacteroidales bacterium]|nr:response regulator transcription factor [Bacteroidales bacterium]